MTINTYTSKLQADGSYVINDPNGNPVMLATKESEANNLVRDMNEVLFRNRKVA